GAWKLNKEESDNPRDRMRQHRDRGGYGGGRPGGGRGPYGGRGEREEDLQRKAGLIEPPRGNPFAMNRRGSDTVRKTGPQAGLHDRWTQAAKVEGFVLRRDRCALGRQAAGHRREGCARE